MAATGYYGGLLEGMQGMAGIQHTFMQDKMLAEKIPQEHLQTQKMVDDIARDRIQQQLLKTAFSGTEWQRNAGDQISNDQNTANKYFGVSRKLMAINPELAMKFQREGEDVLSKATTRETAVLTQKEKQFELVGDIMSTITDQQSLNKAAPELAKLGMPLGKDDLIYNEKTAEKFRKQSMLSKRAVEAAKVDQAERKIEETEREHREQDKAREQRIQHGKVMESIAKERLTRTGKGKYKPMSDSSLDQEIKALKMDEAFNDLDKGDQVKVANDIDRRAFDLVQGGMDVLAAQYAAEEEAKSAIKDGKYLGMASVADQQRREQAAKAKGATGSFGEDQPKSQEESAAISAWGEYDPSSYDYRIGEDGQIQRRRK